MKFKVKRRSSSIVCLRLGLLALAVLHVGCNKTVVSDKIVPIATSTPAKQEPTRKGIGDGLADTKSTIRLTGTKCDAERLTEFEVKVAGLSNTTWTKFLCSDKTKEIKIDTKKGYCNVLQLRAHVSMTKAGFADDYYRETAKQVDRSFFKIDQMVGDDKKIIGTNIHFEDTNDSYWNNTYKPCLDKVKAESDTIKDVIEGDMKTCARILGKEPGKSAAVDWNDFEFSVESDEVEFTVENFPEIGCSPK